MTIQESDEAWSAFLRLKKAKEGYCERGSYLRAK